MRMIRALDLPGEFFEYREMEALSPVKEIINEVRKRGDHAVIDYTRKFDGVALSYIQFRKTSIPSAYRKVAPETLEAIKKAAENIRKFAEVQKQQYRDFEVDLLPGVTTGQRVIPLERVGVYVPGGTFPLLSSLLMGAVPAKVAGVEEIMICSPPTVQESIHPAIVVAADMIGVDEIYQVGGIQAIAAMAYGTETIRPVDKIVGPGNKYVVQAKKEVFGRVGIDLIAGPTEVLILADESADPKILAADLLAQAEHDVDATPILITTSEKLALEVILHVQQQLDNLLTRETAEAAIEERGLIILADSMSEALEITNRKAPEHLEIQVQNPSALVSTLRNYGSLFIGELTAEVLGDYSSGINHTLPTNTTARYRGGLGVQDFLKFQTTLKVTETGFREIGPVAEALAAAEGLDGHRRSVEARRNKLAGL